MPLEQLAGADAQPLARVVVAWAPAGAVAAAILAAAAPWPRGVRAAVVALVFALVLVVAGAASDAAAISESVQSHLAAQIRRPGTWAAVMVAGLAALLPPAARRWRKHGTRAA